MKDECKLGEMVQHEDDGTYTAIVAMVGMPAEEDATKMAAIMSNTVAQYLKSKGINPASTILHN